MKNLVYFELRKIFSRRLAFISFIGILLISAILSFSSYQNKYAFDGVDLVEGTGRTAVQLTGKLLRNMREY